ncbi:ribonuclease HII [Candidatus Uhrbacteria bacterium]|nr:ribonuclease HII [Candidatus Uhrbacteria bacterium]
MLFPTLKVEQSLWKKGVQLVAGVDEVGRGAFAGPIVAGAVMITAPHEFARMKRRNEFSRIRDSKTVSEKEREELYERLIASGIVWSVGVVHVARIDVVGIGRANREAIVRAVTALATKPAHVLVDVIRVRELAIPYTSVPDGDGRVFSIAAASIIAKVTRDRMMRKLHEQYPHYGFDEHKGYGTAQHQRMLRAHGLCPEHRRSFAPIRRLSDSKSRG